MYIIAIAWLYVIILMAATEPSFIGGLLTLVFYGLVPLALFLWLFGTPQRRRNQIAAQHAAQHGEQPDAPTAPDESAR
jgi:hypothetical protein